MGYTVLPNDTTFEKFLVMVGDGANGKSTVANILVRMLGEENVSHVPLDRIGGEFRLWQMMNKQANIVADMNRMEKVEEGLLKSLVSGDPIQINRKNQPPVTMRPTAKLIFGTNSLPPISDRSNGVWRRMITIPFLEHFDEDRRDRCRAEQLRDELPGIFNWVLEGARRLLQQDGFTPCAICSGCLSDYRVASDPIAQFVESCTRVHPDNTRASVQCKVLYDSYRNWCEENGRRHVNSSEFGRQILAIKGSGRTENRAVPANANIQVFR